MGEAVSELDVDVLAIQEVDRDTRRVDHRDLAASVHEAFGGELLWATAFTVPTGGLYGNALLVRGEMRDTDVLALPGRRRGRGSEPRVAAIALAVVDGCPWTIVNTHLSTVSFVAADQLSYLLDALRAWPAPRVLLGDLNLQPDLLLPWLSAESYRLALGPLTHPAHQPRRQIDHVAVTGRGCAVMPIEAVQLAVGDHRALLAEVTRPD